jgi:hypothetical protein
MQVTRSAKGTIAFSVALTLAVVYCNTNAICISDLRLPAISICGRDLGHLANGVVVAPLTLVLLGGVVFGIWNSTRNAYAPALALGALSLAICVLAGLWFLLTGSLVSAFICATVIISAALATGYAFKGWRDAARAAAG